LRVLSVFSKVKAYAFITYVPPPHIDDVSSWCFTSHEIGHGILSAEKSFSYAVSSVVKKHEKEIADQTEAFAKIINSETIEVGHASEIVVNYMAEIASDLIATALCSEAYLYSFKEEYGLSKEWSESHPPLTLRISHVLEIFERNQWIPKNRYRDKTLKDKADGHGYEGISKLVLEMTEELLDFRLNGTSLKEALASLSSKHSAILSRQAWALLEEFDAQAIVECMNGENDVDDVTANEAAEKLTMAGRFSNFSEVIACASMFRSAFGKKERLDKTIMDTTHRTFVRHLYEKARKYKG